ncbi:uncharacterized protein At5g19025-like [Ipomoea triloba]|uniref:uncharacterized protein At5g19025-like n=1 Tax=Ipomoea triloba TaxID=35885 RepID=UPI00125CEC88|nr:uncharacterized protein At5g19025-like [Ipomoea triloba]
MRLPMVDCRSLIEFCRAFEPRRNRNRFNANSQSKNRLSRNKNHCYFNLLAHPFCSDHSPMAAVDAVILILVLGSLGFLIIPYFKSVTCLVFPVLFDAVVEVISDAPVAYFVGLLATLLGVVVVIVAWEIIDLRSRRCGNPNCQGLRKAVEFDIQLESEECLKYLPPDASVNGNVFYNYGAKPLDLGQDRKELEAELKRMAPLNGRTVLIFRAPCGCPAGRLEVWGNKKIRKIKK